MTLPGDRLPEEVVGTGTPGTRPADAADPAPVWDVTGTRWSWVTEHAGYVCDDPEYLGPVATTPGGIPIDRQPFYAQPPTDFQQAVAEQHPEDTEA